MSGTCGIGLSGGIPDVAEITAMITPEIKGAFKYTMGAGDSSAKENEGDETTEKHVKASEGDAADDETIPKRCPPSS